MMSETPNRASADLLPPTLLPAAAREGILAQLQPSLILSHSGRSVLFASHAFARRLGLPDGASLMQAGLPRLAPGTLRLEALAQHPPEFPHPERLRFAIANGQQILNAQVAPLALSDGTPALLVSLIEGASLGAAAYSAAAPESEIPPSAAAEPAAVDAPTAPPTPAVLAPEIPAPKIPAPEIAASAAPRPARFVFTLSREGWIETLSPAFAAALGTPAEALAGQAMASVAGALDRHAGEAIEKAIAAGTTWGGIRLNWPLPAEGRAVPVVLSAMPLHGASGLTGFSGFGRCLFDEAMPLGGATPAAQQASPAQPAPPAEVPPSAEISSPASEVAASALPPAEAQRDLERALLAFANDDAEAQDLASPAPAPAVQAPVEPAPAAAEPALPLSAAPEPAAPEPAAPEPALPEASAQGAPAAAEGANVVSLRPGQLDLPPGLPPHLARPGLSMSERNAFREIARALGAKFDPDGEEAAASSAEAPAPEETGLEQAAPQASVTAPPAAEDSSTPSQTGAEATPFNGMLVDYLPIGVLVMRGEEAVFVNRTLLDLAGYADLEEFNALDGLRALFRKGTMPREREDGFDTVVLATREGQLIPVDAHLQRVDWNGAPAALIAMRRAVELEQGKALTSVAQDLRRARAESAELRAVLDTATDGVITLNDKGEILSLNGAAEALFGLSQNEVAGLGLAHLLHNESHALALDYFDGLKANGVRSVLNDGREVWGREKKGGRMPLFLTLGRISDDEPRRFCAVLRDLTAWKRAEAELTEARRAAESASAKKSDFLAKVGHEIRTPMNAIIGFAEMMQDERLGPVGNAKYKEYLGDIRASGLHVVSLVNDLLDLSKIEAGRMEMQFAATDLNAIVSGCVGMIQPQATQLRVLVRSQLAAKLPPVVADERSIRQIILNLLSNATRFTASGGQVLVATALQDNGEALIRIRDTGVGMSAAEIEQALESYRQVGPRRDHGGTGLGLPLSKALAEANRANFSIRSAPGEGTTVEISFPPTRVLAE